MEADRNDAHLDSSEGKERWEVAMNAGYKIMEFPEDDWTEEELEEGSVAARRASLCFAQQMVVTDVARSPVDVNRILTRLISEAGHG